MKSSLWAEPSSRLPAPVGVRVKSSLWAEPGSRRSPGEVFLFVRASVRFSSHFRFGCGGALGRYKASPPIRSKRIGPSALLMSG